MYVELQFDQGGVDRVIDLSRGLYTSDDHLTGMKTAKVDSLYFEV